MAARTGRQTVVVDVLLNSRQRRALAAIIPCDGTRPLIEYLEGEDANLHGLSVDETLRYASELEKLDLIDVNPNEDGTDCVVTLSSAAASYFTDRRIRAAKSVANRAIQVLAGASGGFIVWLLTHLAE